MNIERGIEFGLAYTLTVASATTASLNGFITAAGVYGVTKAIGLCGAAAVGCHGPALIVKAKRRLGWSGAVFGVAVTAICLGATLWGGMGTNATGGASLRAERAKVKTTAKDDRAEIERIQRERDKIDPRPIGAIKAELETAKAGKWYRATDGCQPDEINGKAAREACDAFRRLEGDLATAETAGRLDAKLASLRATDRQAPVAVDIDPQASAFSQLTGLSVDTSIALYAFWLSLAFELGAMFTMLVAYSHPEPVKTPIAEMVVAPPMPLTAIVSPTRAIIERFMLACLPRARGEEITVGAVYKRLLRFCDDNKLPAPKEREFWEIFEPLCERVGIRIRKRGGRVYCCDVKLAA